MILIVRADQLPLPLVLGLGLPALTSKGSRHWPKLYDESIGCHFKRSRASEQVSQSVSQSVHKASERPTRARCRLRDKSDAPPPTTCCPAFSFSLFCRTNTHSSTEQTTTTSSRHCPLCVVSQSVSESSCYVTIGKQSADKLWPQQSECNQLARRVNYHYCWWSCCLSTQHTNAHSLTEPSSEPGNSSSSGSFFRSDSFKLAAANSAGQRKLADCAFANCRNSTDRSIDRSIHQSTPKRRILFSYPIQFVTSKLTNCCCAERIMQISVSRKGVIDRP